MKDHIERYQKIVERLIEKSFPILRNTKIKVAEKSMKSKARAIYFLWVTKILISPKLRKYSNRVLKGLFVHELCHFEQFKEWGFIRTALGSLLSLIFLKYREKKEKATDLLAIRKGYGKDLILTKRTLGHRKKRFYLSPEEINKYMEKLK